MSSRAISFPRCDSIFQRKHRLFDQSPRNHRSRDRKGQDRHLGTIAPANAGFSHIGNFHLKNGWLCAQASDNSELTTALCADNPAQVGAVYQLAENKYELCAPESLRLETYSTMTSVVNHATVTNYDQYIAVCMTRGSGDRLYATDKVLSSKMSVTSNPFVPINAIFSVEYGGTVGINKVERMTRRWDGRVVAAPPSGGADQVWSVY